MSGVSEPVQSIIEQRMSSAPSDEPIDTVEREVQPKQGSFIHTIPAFAARNQDIDGTSTVCIDIYDGFYVVSKKDE